MARAWKIPHLSPGEPLRAGLRKMIATRCREMFSCAAATLRGDDPAALHDMRVSARRLQAVLRLHRECFPDGQYRKIYRPLRDLIRTLGAVRELDVLLDWLGQRAAPLAPDERFALELLIARHRRQREAAVRSMQASLGTTAVAGLKDRIIDFANRIP
jgi:CHAD domain-containing protein